MIKELEDLSKNGIVVEVGEKKYRLKVHLFGSYGDIPSVSEVNSLTGHTSYYGCRFCTFRGDRVSNTMCFGYATNNPNDPVKNRTIEDFKNGDVIHGIKKASIFKDLPSFIKPSFMGIDEFHLFAMNLSKQIRDWSCQKKIKTMLYLKPRYQKEIAENLQDQCRFLPSIFEGDLKDLVTNLKNVRGVDYMVFLKFVVPTLLVEQLQVQEDNKKVRKQKKEDVKIAITALNAISKVCCIATQHVITNDELLEIDRLVIVWQDFLRSNMPANVFSINQHYLSHLTDVIREVGPLPQVICRSMERRIGRIKKKINSTFNPEKNAENIFINEAYRNYDKRCSALTTASDDNAYDDDVALEFVESDFRFKTTIDAYEYLDLTTALSSLWGVDKDTINKDILIASSIHSNNKRKTFDSHLKGSSRKIKLAKYSLVKLRSDVDEEFERVPYLCRTLLIFKHIQDGQEAMMAMIQLYVNVSISEGNIPYCSLREKANQSELSDKTIIEMVPVNDLVKPVAAMVSNLKHKNRMYFFWPDMPRSSIEVGQVDGFSGYP